MMVHVDLGGAVAAEGLPAVVRHRERRLRRVHAEIVHGIDPNDAEVHGSAVVGSHLAPAHAGVIRAVDAALLLVLDAGIDDIRVAAEDVQPDPAQGPLRNPLAEPAPAAAPIAAPPDSAAAAAAAEAA